VLTAGELADLPIAKFEPDPGPWPGPCRRCGSCCRMFPLPYSPRQLRRVMTAPHVDDETIKAMVIPVAQRREVDGRFRSGFWYTCRHFREDLGDGRPGCAIHATRPAMCRDFPYGNPNNLPHCSASCVWSEANRPGS